MSAGANSIRILAVDDHPLFRSGIAALLATQPDMSLVAEASNGREAMIAIRDEFPEARIIVLTTYTGDVQILRAMESGAWAYPNKILLDKELLETIGAVN